MGGGQHLEVVVQLALGQACELLAMNVLRTTDRPQRAARAFTEQHCRTQRPRPCMLIGCVHAVGCCSYRQIVVVEKVVDEVPALTQTVQYVRTTHQLA